LNHLVLEHLSGVKGGFPLEEAYYLKLSLFKALSTFPEDFLCYIDVWFLTTTWCGSVPLDCSYVLLWIDTVVFYFCSDYLEDYQQFIGDNHQPKE
jgi:hypothetical protein